MFIFAKPFLFNRYINPYTYIQKIKFIIDGYIQGKFDIIGYRVRNVKDSVKGAMVTGKRSHY